MSEDDAVGDELGRASETLEFDDTPGDGRSARVALADGSNSDGTSLERGASVLRMIEGHGRGTTCPHCAGVLPGRWGKMRSGSPRWRCASCQRTFCAATGTVFLGVHDIDKFAELLADMMSDSPRSCRALAAALDVDKDTIWRWRRKVALALIEQSPTTPEQPGEAGSVVMRESRKASREWVRQEREPLRFPAPNRRRWIDYRLLRLPLPLPMTPHLVTVWLNAVGTESGWAEIEKGAPTAEGNYSMPGVGQTTSGSETAKIAEVGVSQGSNAEPLALPDRGAMPEQGEWARSAVAAPGSDGRSTAMGVASPIQTDTFDHTAVTTSPGSLTSAFVTFLSPFRGPATRYLDGYVAWFLARLPESVEDRLARLWTRLMTGGPTPFADMQSG